jgi:hypothetical protein
MSPLCTRIPCGRCVVPVTDAVAHVDVVHVDVVHVDVTDVVDADVVDVHVAVATPVASSVAAAPVATAAGIVDAVDADVAAVFLCVCVCSSLCGLQRLKRRARCLEKVSPLHWPRVAPTGIPLLGFVSLIDMSSRLG